MTKQYQVHDDKIVDTHTGKVEMILSIPKYESTLNFTCKIMNGELVPKWELLGNGDEVLIWIPPLMASL
jgi:hypothetical protein